MIISDGSETMYLLYLESERRNNMRRYLSCDTLICWMDLRWSSIIKQLPPTHQSHLLVFCLKFLTFSKFDLRLYNYNIFFSSFEHVESIFNRFHISVLHARPNLFIPFPLLWIKETTTLLFRLKPPCASTLFAESGSLSYITDYFDFSGGGGSRTKCSLTLEFKFLMSSQSSPLLSRSSYQCEIELTDCWNFPNVQLLFS